MERIVKENHIITNIEKVEELLSKILGGKVDVEKMIHFIESEKNTKFYFNSLLNLRNENDKDVCYVWLDTGYQCYDEPIFISLKKFDNEFCGYFVGTGKQLVRGMGDRNQYYYNDYRNNLSRFVKKYIEKVKERTTKKIELEEMNAFEGLTKMLEENGFSVTGKQEGCNNKRIEYYKALSDVTDEVYSHLLYPVWHSIEGLDRYIKILGTRAKQMVEKGEEKYFVKNNIGSIIINSGLMNLFGRDYLILYRYHEKYQNYIAYKIVNSKRDFLENGFTKEQASAELYPITFFNENETIFKPTIEEFDLNQHTLMHIIEERRSRFPENLQNEEANKIASRIINALERGVKLQQRDLSYAKATYSGKDGSIAWIMPLHINESITKEPELVMIICKREEFYEVKTVLPYDDRVKDRIIALSLYNGLW